MLDFLLAVAVILGLVGVAWYGCRDVKDNGRTTAYERWKNGGYG